MKAETKELIEDIKKRLLYSIAKKKSMIVFLQGAKKI